MAKKKGGKSKKKDGGSDLPIQKFEPMPRTWPGKMSDENLFNKFAQDVREKIDLAHVDQHVCLHVRQLDWDFHSFFITLPKDATICQLQHEIAKVQHLGSVHPDQIIVYKGAGDAKTSDSAKEGATQSATAAGAKHSQGSERQPDRDGDSSHSTDFSSPSHHKHEDASSGTAGSGQGHGESSAAANDHSSKSAHSSTSNLRSSENRTSCDDPTATLRACFPEVAAFELEQTRQALASSLALKQMHDGSKHEAAGGDGDGDSNLDGEPTDTHESPRSSKKHSRKRDKRSGSRPSSAKSAASSAVTSTTATSSAVNRVICGEPSVVFLHNLVARKPKTVRQSMGDMTQTTANATIATKSDASMGGSKLQQMIGANRTGGTSAATGSAAAAAAVGNSPAAAKRRPTSLFQQLAASKLASRQISEPPAPPPAIGRAVQQLSFGRPLSEPMPKAVTVFYDVLPYISRSLKAAELRESQDDHDARVKNLLQRTLSSLSPSRRVSAIITQSTSGTLTQWQRRKSAILIATQSRRKSIFDEDDDNNMMQPSSMSQISRDFKAMARRTSMQGIIKSRSMRGRVAPGQDALKDCLAEPICNEKHPEFDINCALLMREQREWSSKSAPQVQAKPAPKSAGDGFMSAVAE